MSTERPRLDEAIQALALERNAEENVGKTYYPRVSAAGRCPRALTYQALGAEVKPLSAQQVVLFADGNLHEDDSINWLKTTNFPVKDTQRSVNVGVIPGNFPEGSRVCGICEKEIPNNVLHGHIDGIIETDNGKYLWEHKTMNERAFARLDTECNEGYVTQCCSYVKGLLDEGELMVGAILLVKSKNNSDFKQVFIEYDAQNDIAFVENEWNGEEFQVLDVIKRTMDMHSQVQEYSTGIDMPDRPYDYDDWHCQWCDYKDHCWTDMDIEINGRETQVVPLESGDPLAVDIADFHRLRREKTFIEGQVKALRSSILTELADRNMKGGSIDGLRFGLYTMKKQRVDMNAVPSDVKKKATKQTVIRTLTTKEV